ncbi:MAG TPA: hypothetical protein VGL81_02395 [Polyangiaceae bacterium]|jgi:hypothetical protein
MRTASIALLAAATAFAGLALGCGGSVFTGASGGGDSGAGDSGGHDAAPFDGSSGPDGGGGPDGSGDDSSPPWSPVCPNTVPAAGTSCDTENVQCEYGSAWWSVSCDQVMQCENGRWSTFQPSFEPCSAQPGPNPASCPADFAAVPQGTSCSTNGLSCLYTEGQCGCQVPLGGPVEIDGGTGFWSCVPEQGCPFPRARLGTACTTAQSDCTYEECSYAQTCQDGVWQAEEEACAGTAGGGPGQ